MYKIAILASGAGSNAKTIINHFKESDLAEVALVISNRAAAGVFEVARETGVKSVHISNKDLERQLLQVLREHQIDFIVLAGFLKKIPTEVIGAFEGRIVNIHPSLLPLYGGKGMYGSRVHEAVFEAKEKESGITIHLVNENYDEGKIIFQEKVTIEESDTPAEIEAKVRKLEHRFYPEVIERAIKNNL